MDHVDHLIMGLACLAWSGAAWVVVNAALCIYVSVTQRGQE